MSDKSLIFKFNEYSENMLDLFVKYVKNILRMSKKISNDSMFEQKIINLKNNNIELYFYDGNEISSMAEKDFNLCHQFKKIINSKYIFIPNNEYIIKQVENFNVKIFNNNKIYFSYIKSTKLKNFILEFIKQYDDYIIKPTQNKHLDQVGITTEKEFKENFKSLNINLAQELGKINRRKKGYNIYHKKYSFDNNYLYISKYTDILNILINAKNIKDFYCDFSKELIKNKRLIVTSNIYNFLQKNENTIYTKYLPNKNTATLFFYFLNIKFKHIDCLLIDNAVYYVNNNKNTIDSDNIIIKNVKMKNEKSKLENHKSNIKIPDTKINYNLDCNIKINKLYDNYYQVLNYNYVLDTLEIKNSNEFCKTVSEKFRKGTYLNHYDRYKYFLTKLYENKPIDLSDTNKTKKCDLLPYVEKTTNDDQKKLTTDSIIPLDVNVNSIIDILSNSELLPSAIGDTIVISGTPPVEPSATTTSETPRESCTNQYNDCDEPEDSSGSEDDEIQETGDDISKVKCVFDNGNNCKQRGSDLLDKVRISNNQPWKICLECYEKHKKLFKD